MKITFCLVLLSVFFISCHNAEPATYYLTKNFEGVFAVVYSQKRGYNKVVDGRRQFYVPYNRILLTSDDFSDGWRDDLFLMESDKGYDTLKMFLPTMDTTGRKFDEAYYKMYTNDVNSIAVNFRQIVNSVPINNNDSKCKFEYELITIGKAVSLNDSAGKAFIERLNKYLKDEFCK